MKIGAKPGGSVHAGIVSIFRIPGKFFLEELQKPGAGRLRSRRKPHRRNGTVERKPGKNG
jgi:hypothetical protein